MKPSRPTLEPRGRYTTAQAARALELHRNTITRKADSGELGCCVCKTNGRRYFYGEALMKFWDAHVM